MNGLFSAYAEVFLLAIDNRASGGTFLCLRRGVSVVVNVSSDGTGFSLPTQRCFRRTRHCDDARRLFSAYAEVFPPLPAVMGNFLSFLCLRRGVSPLTTSAETLDDFSLPTQRCFQFHRLLPARTTLFSAYAEVFLPSTSPPIITRTFLCLRRGVSTAKACELDLFFFSLPTQRCFRLGDWES